MGLLDDAIREHLELKRRRGADPNEVERLEQEALGPVRRGPQVSDEPFHEEEEHFEDEDHGALLYDDEAENGHAEPGQVAPGAAFTEDMREPFPEDESERGWSHEAAEAWDEDEPLPADEHPAPAAEAPASSPRETPPPAPAEPAEPVDHPGQETVEYDVEGEEGRAKSEEDVLEETPEFLQDAPEHDRLWFEQKPPRDFDFDK